MVSNDIFENTLEEYVNLSTSGRVDEKDVVPLMQIMELKNIGTQLNYIVILQDENEKFS